MKLLEKTSRQLEQEGYSPHSVYRYLLWMKRYIEFHYRAHPATLEERHVRLFLLHLQHRKSCSAYDIAQCRSALLFLYRRVLGISDFVIYDPGHPSEAPNPVLLDSSV